MLIAHPSSQKRLARCCASGSLSRGIVEPGDLGKDALALLPRHDATACRPPVLASSAYVPEERQHDQDSSSTGPCRDAGDCACGLLLCRPW